MKRPQFHHAMYRQFMRVIFLLLCAACVTRADAAEEGQAPFTACLLSEGSACRIVATAVGVKIASDGDRGPTVVFLTPGPNGFSQVSSLNVQGDLMAQDGSVDIDSINSANDIFAQLQDRSESSYFFPPSAVELKTAIGFNPDAEISGDDYVAMLKVHMQMTLGVTPVVSDYLVNKMVMVMSTDASAHVPSGSLSSGGSDESFSKPLSAAPALENAESETSTN